MILSLRFFDNSILNIFAYVIAVPLTIIFIGLIIELFTKTVIPFTRSTVKIIFDYSHLVLLLVSAFYIFYYLGSLNNGNLETNFIFEKNIAEAALKLSYILFSVGAGSGVLKFISTFSVFKKQFKKMVLSEEFDNVLSDKLEILAYSENYLRKHNNLNKIWKKITLLKYQNDFPLIYEKLEDKISNLFFQPDSTSFYYSNFEIQFHFELHKNLNNITISTAVRYIIVRPNEQEFTWTFNYNQLEADFNNKSTNVELIADGEKFEFNNDNSKVEPIDENIKVSIEKIFEGKKSYPIRIIRDMIQNIENDRLYTFGTNRIIDNLKVEISTCDKLNYVFSPIGPLNFEKEDNHNYGNTEKEIFTLYDVITPGEVFKIFLIRK